MLIKLALRNVKRQFRNYAVYFTTVMITVALIFSVVNSVYSSNLIKAVTSETEISDDIKSKGVIVAMIIISAIISLIISRAQLFILSIRKQELGTYKLLGMKNKKITGIFIAETGFIYILTVISGMLLGLFFYQGLNSILARFTGADFELTGYSFKTVITTLGLALIIFAVSAVSSAEYLKKTDINQLINNRKKKESKINKSSYKLGTFLCILSVIIWLILLEFFREAYGMATEGKAVLLDFIENTFKIDEKQKEGAFSFIVIGLSYIAVPVTILVFNMSYPRCLINAVMKNKKICSKGTNTFILRQLSSKSNANASMFGAIAILVTFTIVLLSVNFTVRESLRNEADYGFDISVEKTSEEKTDDIISKYTGISSKADVTMLYLPGMKIKHNSMGKSTTISCAENLLKAEGKAFEPDDKNCYYISVCSNKQKNEMFGITNTELLTKDKIEYNDISISPGKTVESDILLPGTVILPDETANLLISENLPADYRTEVYYFLDGSKYDVDAMNNEFKENGIALLYFRDLLTKEAFTDFAPTCMVILFCIVSFLILSMAIIGLKASSEVNDDRIRYQKLYHMGVSKKTLCGILMKQTALFFIFPLVQPVIFTFFVSDILGKMFSLFSADDLHTPNQTVYILFFIAVIYTTYFIITYNFLKNKIIMEKEQRKIL